MCVCVSNHFQPMQGVDGIVKAQGLDQAGIGWLADTKEEQGWGEEEWVVERRA